MNKGIEILLERMKSNPEEFISEANYGESKWSAMVSYFKGFLDEEEVKTLMDAWQENTKKVMQERFTQQVMKELLDPKEESNPYLASSATRLGGATLGQSTGLTNGGFTLTNNGAGTGYNWANTGAVTGTISANSLTLGNTTISEAGLNQMLATHKAMRE